MKREYSRHTFEKYSDMKFHENPSSGSRVIQCGWTMAGVRDDYGRHNHHHHHHHFDFIFSKSVHLLALVRTVAFLFVPLIV